MHLDYQAFDADNHYYEAIDAFTRHLDPSYAQAHDAVGRDRRQAAAARRRARSTASSRTRRSTRSPRPGASTTTSAAASPGDDIRAAFGELEPISPAYRDRDAAARGDGRAGHRGRASCSRRSASAWRRRSSTTPRRLHAAFHAFNRWLDDDWGFDYQDRIFAAPYFTLLDPDRAVAELEWALEHGAAVIVMRAGPVHGPTAAARPATRCTTRSGRGSTRPASSSPTTRATTRLRPLRRRLGRGRRDRGVPPQRRSAIVTGGRPADLRHDRRARSCHGVFARYPEPARRHDRERLASGCRLLRRS